MVDEDNYGTRLTQITIAADAVVVITFQFDVSSYSFVRRCRDVGGVGRVAVRQCQTASICWFH